MASNEEVLVKGMAKAKGIIRDAIINRLGEIGKASTKHALTVTREYTHRTFNLRDSYGYGIYENGRLIETWMNNPSANKPDEKGGYGKDRGVSFLEGYVPEGKGYSLIVVAGEFYADYLENVKGLDVLTGAYQYTAEESESMFRRMSA